MQGKVELVVFDIGRVMIQLIAGWREACAAVGAPYVDAIDHEETRKRVYETIYFLEIGKIDPDEHARRVGALLGTEPETVDKVMRAWLGRPFEGLDGLIDDIHDRGMKTACLSNTNQTHWQMMTQGEGPARLPLEKLNYRFASHLVGAFKPEPAIYEALERETGVSAEWIVFFDDMEANCRGALARGWRAHQILHPGDPVAQIRGHLGL